MHKFLRTIGFSDIRKKDLEIIISDIVEHPDVMKVTKDSEENEFVEMLKEFAPGIGIKVCGSYDEDDRFQMDYYYPFFDAVTLTTQECIEVQKHAEKESYAGICDETNLGVTLIFYMQNVADYLAECQLQRKSPISVARLSALSTEGRIVLPVEKREKKNPSDYDYKDRNQLIAKAREGDEDAIESLTLEDMDTYSLISKRVLQEDILSIVTTSFMPYGVESDQYAILGEIVDVMQCRNKLSGDSIYKMKVECNDIFFDVCINANDLIGEPQIGRRFKGNVWMQGSVCL